MTPQAYSLIQNIVSGLKQRNGCGIPSTFFVTVASEQMASCAFATLPLPELQPNTPTYCRQLILQIECKQGSSGT